VARFYADEQYPFPVVELLRSMGHDALTVQEGGNEGMPDEEVLAFAVRENRTILTINRRHFVRLHRLQPDHCGIIVCSLDNNWYYQATKINEAVSTEETLRGMLIRVYKSPQ